MPLVHVNLGPRSYDIEIGTGIVDTAGTFLMNRRRVDHAVVITDARVDHPHAQQVAASLAAAGVTVDELVVEDGEQTKSTDSVQHLWQKLFEVKADRQTVVVAVGGGMVGDLAGFVAATFVRGLPFMQVPTTLLAQVDSSVGGKVGVNLPGGKNMVGSFWQPLGVLIDTSVLKTLPEREYRSGLAEVVKYAVILDPELMSYLEANVVGLLDRRHAVLEHTIMRCCRLKADVVEEDEFEISGRRAVLNYGHTFGHALEAVTGYGTYLHGEAVSIGMMCAARLAERLGRIDERLTDRQHDLLVALGLPVTLLDVDPDALIDAMAHDKKVSQGKLRFVLPTRIGQVELVGDIGVRDVRASLFG